MADSTVKVVLGGEEIDVPKLLTEDKDIFHEVMNVDALCQGLTAEEKEKLQPLLPKSPSLGFKEGLTTALSPDNVRFGISPLDTMWDKLSSGSLSLETHHVQEEIRSLARRHYKLGQAHYFVKLLQELVVSRQDVLQRALFAGSLENMWKGGGQKKRSHLEGDSEGTCQAKRRSPGDYQYRRILHEMGCADEGEDESVSSSQTSETDSLSEAEYRKLLRKHRRHRKKHQVSYLSVMDRLSEKTASGTPAPPQGKKHHHHHHHHHSHHHSHHPPEDEQWVTPIHHSSSKKSSSKVEQEGGVSKKEVGGTSRRGRKMMQERCQHERTTAAQAKAIYKVYSPIDKGSLPEAQLEPIVLNQPLPTSKYKSYFSLLKAVFDPLNDKKAELAKVSKNLSHLMRSGECADCKWLEQRSDWVELALSSLCYLAAEVGAYSSFSPLPHFIPLIEFRDRIDHWRWIGAGRDSELELYVLSKHWLDNLDKALPVVDYSDYEPLPPHVWTKLGFVKSSPEELIKFRKMERERYASPHKSYIYSIRGYESPVGPVKGAKVYKKESGSKARGHALLVPNRPTCVTILSLVRDATSRLPNGEGTRLDLCIQVQDSQYIAESVSETQLNNAVSGALDRLHYEKDPCVRYDGTRKVWIYLHRGRNEEDFERIHWACEVAAKQRKMLMARPKQRPEIILRVDGSDKVLDVGTGGEDATRMVRKTVVRPALPPASVATATTVSLSSSSSSSLVGLSGSSAASAESLALGMTTPTISQLLPQVATPTTPHILPQPAQLSMVVASAVQGGSTMLSEEVGVTTYNPSLKVSLQSKRAKVASKIQESLEAQKSSNRKRKQSLKMAELLQDGTQVHLSHSSSSMSSGWSSDSEEPAPSPGLRPPELILDTSVGSTSEVRKPEEDWVSSEGVSPDTSFDDY